MYILLENCNKFFYLQISYINNGTADLNNYIHKGVGVSFSKIINNNFIV